jgi:hypothetical protein
MSVITAVTMLISAAVIAVFGALIRYYEMVELIAGYDSSTVTDDASLAEFVGRNLLYVAGLNATTAVVAYLQLFDSAVLWIGYGVVVTGLAIWIAVESRQYAE